jgi:hypothetical protein
MQRACDVSTIAAYRTHHTEHRALRRATQLSLCVSLCLSLSLAPFLCVCACTLIGWDPITEPAAGGLPPGRTTEIRPGTPIIIFTFTRHRGDFRCELPTRQEARAGARCDAEFFPPCAAADRVPALPRLLRGGARGGGETETMRRRQMSERRTEGEGEGQRYTQ